MNSNKNHIHYLRKYVKLLSKNILTEFELLFLEVIQSYRDSDAIRYFVIGLGKVEGLAERKNRRKNEKNDVTLPCYIFIGVHEYDELIKFFSKITRSCV